MKVNIGRYPKKGERKISIKIDNFDTWSLDHTLALILLPALLQLKEKKHGIPGEFVNDIADEYHNQRTFDFLQDDKDEVFNKGAQKWDDILDKIIWSFQQLAIDDYETKYHHGEMNVGWKESEYTVPNINTGVPEKTYEMIDKNPDEHWYDAVGHRVHEERIQEGLELFGKYYRSLWD